MKPDRAAAVRRAEVSLRRADAGPGDAAGRRLHRGADRHLLGGRQLQPRRRVVRLGAPRDGHRRLPATPSIARHQPSQAGAAQAAQRRHVRLTDFEIADGSGRPLLSGADLVRRRRARPCTSTANSSTGKSTLVRVLAGLWPRARGSLALPDRAQVMITPQKSLPAARLAQGRAALSQPVAAGAPTTACTAALGKVGLEALGPRLDERARWDQVLSNGERQRLAIARLLIHRPQVVDPRRRALGAGGDRASRPCWRACAAELPGATIISLGQRPAPSGAHERQLRWSGAATTRCCCRRARRRWRPRHSNASRKGGLATSRCHDQAQLLERDLEPRRGAVPLRPALRRVPGREEGARSRPSSTSAPATTTSSG